MVQGIDAFGWVGLVTYFAVMAFVVKGVQIPVPILLSEPLLYLLVLLRLRDPPRRAHTPPIRKTLSPAPDSEVTEAWSSSQSSSRSRPQSRIGLPSSATFEEEGGLGRIEDTLTIEEDGRLRIPLDLRTAPVAGVVLLLITRTIDGSVLCQGIVGEEGVRPYDVLVLFISLAYISTALDSTGGLRALAFYISQRSARVPKQRAPSADKAASGVRLYATLYAFWFMAGVLFGNDPVILSGTAFLGYFTRVTGITTPTAWTFSQFIAANIASAALVSSNPTNVLIAGAFELDFLTGYTKNTLLPSVVTAIVAFPILFATFFYLKPPSPNASDASQSAQAYIPAQLLPPDVNPLSALVDPNGAIFHSGIMAVTLTILLGTSFVGGGKVRVWTVTAPAGIIALVRDLWSERKVAKVVQHVEEGIELDSFSIRQGRPPATPDPHLSLPFFARKFTKRFPTTSATISRLPLSLLPFAGGIFILSRALTSLGWTSIFAHWLAKICINPSAAVFFLGYFTALVLCPLCGTNIGATILLVEILRDPNFHRAPHVVADPRILTGAIFSTAMASNLGAFSWTFSSSLAGLLWVSILRQKGIVVKGTEFAKWNCLFLPVLSTVASGVVLFQCYYF